MSIVTWQLGNFLHGFETSEISPNQKPAVSLPWDEVGFHHVPSCTSSSTGYSSLFHISRGRPPPSPTLAEIAPLFIRRTCCVALTSARAEKQKGNAWEILAPLRAYHFFAICSTRVRVLVCTCTFLFAACARLCVCGAHC